MITREEAGKAYSYLNGVFGAVGKPQRVAWDKNETVHWLMLGTPFNATLTLTRSGDLHFEMFVDIELDGGLDFCSDIYVIAVSLREFFRECKTEFRRMCADINKGTVQVLERDIKKARTVRNQIKKFASRRV